MTTVSRTLAAVLFATVATPWLGGTAQADAGDAALGIFGGLFLGEILNQGRRQAAPQKQVIVVPQHAPASSYQHSAPKVETSAEQRLANLRRLHDKGLITQSEYVTA